MDQLDRVYVIGAGFSAGLGYPLTSDLLVRLWDRIDEEFRTRLKRAICFHHPDFDPERFTSFPNVEQLLSELQVNEQLFDASDQYETTFTKEQLRNLQTDLLLEVARWFHEISKSVVPNAPTVSWLSKFKEQVMRQRAAVISFNWDLILDQLLFADGINEASYGFTIGEDQIPSLLKPHGSLNWFEEGIGRHLKSVKRVTVFDNGPDTVYAFREFRAPVSKSTRIYSPLIVPPVYLKNFEKPVFKALWRNCVTVLNQARQVVFLGYSMPLADHHAQFIMRCGFQKRIVSDPCVQGTPEVVIVNPDWGAARRISSIVGSEYRCSWASTPVSEWIERGSVTETS